MAQEPTLRVLLGGSGSTGSSLLRTVLNRHPEIFSGDELNFFNKEQYFEDWTKYKHRIFSRFRPPLSTKGWFPYPGHSLLHKDYRWKADSLQKLVQTSSSIEDFVDSYFEKILDSYGKKIWIEKTPSNSYSFRYFLRVFPQGKVIHISRNPLDAVASYLRSTKRSPYFVCCLWLYNAASALSVANDQRYFSVRYEDLIANPVGTMRSILAFIGLEFTPNILQPSAIDTTDHTRNVGWRYDRTARITKNNKRTFNLLPENLQQEIIGILSSISISHKHFTSKNLIHSSCIEVCNALGYDFKASKLVNPKNLALEYIKDIAHRTNKLYPTNILFYPINIRFKANG